MSPIYLTPDSKDLQHGSEVLGFFSNIANRRMSFILEKKDPTMFLWA